MSPTRRAMLARTGLAATAGVIPVSFSGALLAAVRPDVGTIEVDPHPAWLARLEELHRIDDGGPYGWPDERWDALTAEMVRLEALIAETPSRTLAGALAQVRSAFLLVDATSVHCDRDAGALGHALATFDRLAGRAAA